MKTHMLLESFHGLYDLCTGKISGSHFTREWGRVTCKLCLRMKKKIKKEVEKCGCKTWQKEEKICT